MRTITLLVALCISFPTLAATHRSQSARVHFVRANACPATGMNKLPCKGYVIDHIKPLCAGGADDPSNMQWQALADSYKKDKQERAYCRSLKK